VAITAILLASVPMFLAGCDSGSDPWEGHEGATRVVVTIAPLQSFVQAVGGDRVAVRCLCTTNGPHNYRPDTRDARVLGKADLLLAIGLTLDESFAEPMLRMARRKDMPYVKLGEQLPESALLEMKHACCKHGEHGHTHHHDKWDPHLWLGIPQAIRLVELIRDELTRIDAAGAESYRLNTTAYVAKLTTLHNNGKAAIAACAVRRIVSFHAALEYMASSFGFEIADVIEEGPGDEPTPGHLTDLVKVCSDPNKPVGAISVEPQYPSSSSATIVQRELKQKKITVPLVMIDPLETADPRELAREGGNWYVERMRLNIEALNQALVAKKKP